ncbi:MAG: tetraprenyl-beta-curcumene synthase family protein [Pelosinus sp.]|nr:tetraprenyl-beta-curcumene synthase family protein [Pelosinus sp.]
MFKILQSCYLITVFVSKIFPKVKCELAYWQKKAQQAEPALKEQALASITAKRFHCLGGSIYSLYTGKFSKNAVRFIVALQTISDYLDNLCDRAGIADEKAFRQLHLAMTDALTPYKPLENYYLYYPYKQDGGYLAALVTTCQKEAAKLPNYLIIQKDILALAGLYSELQTYKHLDPVTREEKIKLWTSTYLPVYPQLTTWEFAAATGSTLGLFALCAAAKSTQLKYELASRIAEAYFPWISTLHILLDYYIDEVEDSLSGDLNFVSYYTANEDIPQRLSFFLKEAFFRIQRLPQSIFHYTILCGLIAMYLSDPKAHTPSKKTATNKILKSAGIYTILLYTICKILRQQKIL